MRVLKKVRVPLQDRTYNVWVGLGASNRIGQWMQSIKPARSTRAIVVGDDALGEHSARICSNLTRMGWQADRIDVRGGEELKDIHTIYPLYSELLRVGADRNTVLIAVGGGSVGDAVGFVAATYMRGIAWIGVPTTLLAQVDSAIGGKTGINHAAGKNLIGAFHQPELVVCDTRFLASLPEREWTSGLGEIVKYALTLDPGLFSELKSYTKTFRLQTAATQTRVIARCIQLKARLVARDEFDRTGQRETLNFGHTFGHALEAASHFSRFRHGEAVIWGMRFAVALSSLRGLINRNTRNSVEEYLKTLNVPAIRPKLTDANLLKLIAHDKKNSNGRRRFVLLRGIGKTVLDANVTDHDIRLAYSDLMGTV